MLLREKIARAIWDGGTNRMWEDMGDERQNYYLTQADAVIEALNLSEEKLGEIVHKNSELDLWDADDLAKAILEEMGK